MQKIFKYQIFPHLTYIKMPSGAKILSLQTQNDEPFIWAIVYPDNPIEEVQIACVPTGSILPDYVLNGDFIGTFQCEGYLVFHVFRLK